MKKVISVSLVVLMCITAVFADDSFVKSKFYPKAYQSLCSQLGLTGTDPSSPSNAVNIAMGSSKYPVTPGDVYSLTYQNPSSYSMVSQNLSVDANYNVYVPYVGTINAKGMTFLEFKKYAETQMKTFYSYLNPQFSIAQCGSFQVYISGETKSTSSVSTWSFARLSDLCDYATDYASSRDVEVTYADGTTKSYDLFKACLLGDEENNPYLTPESTIRFKTAEKTVWITGAVKLPGQYQLKDNETLSDLVSIARGFTYDANKSSIAVSSYENGVYSTLSIDYSKQEGYELKDLDTVTVAQLSDLPSVVTIQGAITDGKINYEYVKGESALQVVVAIKDSLLTTSNIDGIYVERGAMRIYVDSDNDVILEEGDIIQVPYKNQQVVVAGAVQKPGTYTYEPGRNAEYYINIAGGYTADAKQKTLKIIDGNGFNMSTDSEIMADYTISVEKRNTNTANYIALGISITSIVLTLFSTIMNSVK